MKLLKQLKKIFFGSYIRGFVTSYLLFMITGVILLKLPWSVQSGVELSWIDAVFTSASALSTTGLSTIVVKDTFTLFGQTMLALIIQFGGIGVIMMVALFWLVVRRKIGFKQRNMIMTDQNQLSRQGIVRFIRDVLIMIFVIEAIAFSIMFIYLYTAGYFSLFDAFFQAFFTTISLFTNAGFDIAPGGDSFQMFANDYFMQVLAMTLMFTGAMGFWPLAEIKEFIIAKFKKEKFKFSLFVKTLVGLHLFIWIVSAVLLYTLESTRFFADKSIVESGFYALFMSLTTRNAGFSTMEVTGFGDFTHVFFTLLMFVGSSPNSAGGGIRTSTLLVVLLGIKTFIMDEDKPVFKKRALKDETVYKSFVAIIVAGLVVFVQVFLMAIFERDQSANEILFEVVSAFGTTGLSLGITAQLGWFGKIILIMTMFIGRIGVLALLLMFRPSRKTKSQVQYPEMDMIVG